MSDNLKFLIMDRNLLRLPNIDVSASSEDLNFPATNAVHPFRSKVWRTSGHWKITSSNRYLNFKESAGGAELTAEIALGDYSPTTLATAIKVALETKTINTRTYTVSYSTTTKKWTISGQVYFEMLSQSGTNAANSIFNDVGFDVLADHTGSISYSGHKIAIHNFESLDVDLYTAEPVNSCAVVWDPRFGINLSSAARIYLQGNATKNFDNPEVNIEMNIDGTNCCATAYSITTYELRYWRIKVVDPLNTDGYVDIGTIFLCSARDFKLPDNGFDYKLRDYSKEQENQFGNSYHDLYPQRKRLEMVFGDIEYNQMKDIESAYRNAGEHHICCVWIDPLRELFDENQFFIYGKLTLQLQLEHVIVDRFKLELNIEEKF